MLVSRLPLLVVAVVVLVEMPESLPRVETAMLGTGITGGATDGAVSPALTTGGVAASGVGKRGWKFGFPIARAGFKSSIVLGLMATILAPNGPVKS